MLIRRLVQRFVSCVWNFRINVTVALAAAFDVASSYLSPPRPRAPCGDPGYRAGSSPHFLVLGIRCSEEYWVREATAPSQDGRIRRLSFPHQGGSLPLSRRKASKRPLLSQSSVPALGFLGKALRSGDLGFSGSASRCLRASLTFSRDW